MRPRKSRSSKMKPLPLFSNVAIRTQQDTRLAERDAEERKRKLQAQQAKKAQ